MLAMFQASSARAVSLTGIAYEEDFPEKAFCKFSYSDVVENGIRKNSKSLHHGLDGTELVKEEQEYFQGNLTKYKYWQHQIGAEGSVTISANKVFMEYKKDGKVLRGEEDNSDNLVVASSMLVHLKDRLGLLIKGEKVVIRLVVVDRVRTFEMEASVIENKLVNHENQVSLSLKPANSLYSWLVKPVVFHFSYKNEQAKLNYFVAPSAVMRKTGRNYETVRTKVVMSNLSDK